MLPPLAKPAKGDILSLYLNICTIAVISVLVKEITKG